MAAYIDEANGGKTDEIGYHRPNSRLFSAGVPIIKNANSMKVVQRAAGANLSVDVSVGDVHLLTNTGTHSYWGFTDTETNVVISAADAVNPRVDTLVAYFDKPAVGTVGNNSPGALKFYVSVGVPSGTPTAKDDTTIQTELGASVPFTKLAYVYVEVGATQIINTSITDAREGINTTAIVGTASIGDGTVTTGKLVNGAVTTAKLDNSSVTSVKLGLPYGRIYFSTVGTAGGQVIAATATATLNFNTLDPDSSLVTMNTGGVLKLDVAGKYTVVAQTRVIDAPQVNQLLRIMMSVDNGTTYTELTTWSVRQDNDAIGRGLSQMAILNAAAGTLILAQYHNGGGGSTRLAAADAATQKYTCSLAVMM